MSAPWFPSGMLLRYFVNLYDMEIIEEEAFLSWKEDLTQEYPGKGKALFQVTWLGFLFFSRLKLFSSTCPFLQGEPMANLAGDCRGGGVRRRRLLKFGPKPCINKMQWLNLYVPWYFLLLTSVMVKILSNEVCFFQINFFFFFFLLQSSLAVDKHWTWPGLFYLILCNIGLKGGPSVTLMRHQVLP